MKKSVLFLVVFLFIDYSSYETLKVAMTKNDVQGMLLDAYVAAYHIQSGKDFRVNNIFESTSTYCIVLGNDMNRKVIFDKLVEYTTAKKADILKDIEASSYKLSVRSLLLHMFKSELLLAFYCFAIRILV